MDEADGEFEVAVTPHYAALMHRYQTGASDDAGDQRYPLRAQALPVRGELDVRGFEMTDPLAEESHMPVPGVTHRYPDRVLWYVSHNCPMYCRHCTRKRKVSDPTTAASTDELEAGLAYIRETTDVRDVLVSGGDPLTLSDSRLDDILGALRSISHVEVIRLGTRNPVTLPQRVTESLCQVVERHAPVYVNTHFNHPRELGPTAAGALQRLSSSGAVLGNQMVLLRGVNDDADTVLRLNRKLLEAGCKPYYMLQCDMAEGITHFRTPLARGLEILESLRGRITGMGIPDFVVDLPGGGGKIELTPERIVEVDQKQEPTLVKFRNWAGEVVCFPDVDDTTD
jgi:lysine 2,3-aminomutase